MARKLRNTAGSLGVAIRAHLLGTGIRAKTLGLVAVPMVFLLLLSTLVVGRSVSDTRRAGQVVEFAGVSTDVAAFVNALQLERSITMTYLQAPSARGFAAMRAHRKAADSALVAVRAALAGSSAARISPALGRAVAQAAAAHRGIAPIRSGVDKATSSPGDVQRRYAMVLQADLALPDLLADAVTDADLAQTLRAYGAISQLIESAAQERNVIVVGSAARRFTPDQYATLTGSIAAQNSVVVALGGLSTPQAKQRLNVLIAGPAAAKFLSYRKTAVNAGSTRTLVIATPAFTAAAAKRALGLRSIQVTYAESVIAIAGQMRSTTRTRALLIAGLLALGVAFPMVHAIVLSRRIVRPLRRLIDSAEQIQAELPRMVERMHQPGADPGLTIEPIQVEGRNEVGRLAEAFNTVNEVIVRVAIEQAALRGSIAEMFVNVARRNQALLGRQLAFLDQLEADEEDPDALRNLFHLDHLAAQMRRNAESLLVLAGSDATRRLRAPMPLSDVIRTAVGEIDGFQRVDLTLYADPEVTGLRALSVAHLLAELLDNATQFSDPQTRVRVSASFDGESVIVDVYDEGLGLTPEDLTDANHRLAAPPATEIAVTQRLGFNVVGRIARHLEIGVELNGRPAGGTVAVVTLPAALFVDGSLPVTAIHRDEPAAVSYEAPAAAAAVPVAAPVPVLEPVGRPALEMPLAVQDILPGRKLQRLAMLFGPPTAATVDAPPAADAAATGPLPIPRPRNAALPGPLPVTTSPAGSSPARPSGSVPVTAPSASVPSADAPASALPQVQPVHSPMRANDMARSALAELSQLSAPYTPSSFDAGGGRASSSSADLNRRIPKPAVEPEPPTQSVTPAPRSAEQVRGHLSGFRAGVQRGRDTQDEPELDERNEDQS